jgi:drug/metabolite transporter (DMT)-like permease
MNPVQQAYLKIHIAVVLFGFTAILGGLIELSALVLVWWRMLFTSISLLFMADFGRIRKTFNKKLALILAGNGVIIALHWLCFYASIKLANASVALVCLASASLFASIIEPLVFKRRISKLEIFMGLLIIPAMVLIVQQLEFSMMYGVWIGILAALLSAFFATINKMIVTEAHSFDITLVELGSGWIFLSLILPFTLTGSNQLIFWPDLSDLMYLLILAFLCTTLAFILSLQSLKHLSAFNSTLIVNLEPVYGIVLAWLILKENEQLNHIFYWGVALIMLIVFSYPLLKRRFGLKVAKI